MNPSSLHPDEALRDYLQGRVSVDVGGAVMENVAVYSDWEKPNNGAPGDFIIVMLNGDVGGVGMDTPYAGGYLLVSLYCKLNEDGSVKKHRVSKILEQFDGLLEGLASGGYFFKYDAERFITPTTPNITAGYSITTLNLKWNTASNFNN